MLDFFLNTMHKGGWFMWPILFFAVSAVLIAGWRLWMVRRANADNRALFSAVAERIEADDIGGALAVCRRRPQAALSQVLTEILTEHGEGVTSLSRVADYATLAQRGRVGTHLHSLLPAAASAALLTGMLGTIQGLMLAFFCGCGCGF